MMYRSLLLVLGTFAVASCGELTECAGDVLHVSFSPQDTTIGLGGQYTARLDLTGCGQKRLSDTITFQSSDTAIATVGTTTGVVIGFRSGTATITAFAAHYHVVAPMTVHVR